MFVFSTVFGSTSSDVSCDGDSGDGVCQYEGMLYEEVCGSTTTTRCIIYRDLETNRIYQECSIETGDWCKLIGTRYTFWVQGETGKERRDRIVHTVDSFVADMVEFMTIFCNAVDGEGYPINPYPDHFCRELAEAYEGLTTRLGDQLNDLGSRPLYLFLPSKGYSVTLDTVGVMLPVHRLPGLKRKGDIYIDIKNIERLRPGFAVSVWDEMAVETDAHERVHLADWIDNGRDDWWDPNNHRRGDRIYRQGEEIANLIGISGVEWSRTCPDPYQVRWMLPSWGLEMPDPNFCRIGEIRKILRR